MRRPYKYAFMLILAFTLALTCCSCQKIEPPPATEPPTTQPPTTVPPTTLPPSTAPTEPPETEPPEPQMLTRFGEYYEMNNDIVGWIQVPNTIIDYPVTQYTDNEYYLTHDFLKEESKDGNPFLAVEADILTANRSMSLFGHHRKNGLMFEPLVNYKKLSYYKSWPVFHFDTLYEESAYVIFSVFYMAGNRTDKQFYYYPVAEFVDDDAFMEHVTQLQKRSIFTTGIDVEADDRIVILTCCTYETDDLRIAVAGRKLRESETVDGFDTSIAELNRNTLYPQKWYDAFGGSPPKDD